jgi:hypothetical protein
VEDDHAVASAGAAALGGPTAETTLTDLPASFDERSGGGAADGGVLG